MEIAVDYYLKKIHAVKEARDSEELERQKAVIEHVKANILSTWELKDEMRSLATIYNELVKCGIEYNGRGALAFTRLSNRTDIGLTGERDKLVISVLDDGDVLDMSFNGYDAYQAVCDPKTEYRWISNFATLLFKFLVHYGDFRDNFLEYVDNLK